MPEPRPVAARRGCASSAAWSWPSAAGPTRRSWPGWPTTRSAPTRALAVTAVSPSLAGDERADCAALAAEWGLRWATVETDELADPAYVGQRRRPLLPLQGRADGRARPAGRGRAAPRWCSASTSTTSATTGPASGRRPSAAPAFPLVDAGFTKADVRAWSRQLGLRTWDKPAAACLASRVPYGTPVTLGVLSRGRAGRGGAARASGFRRAAGAPLRRHGPPRGAGRRPRRACVDAARGGRGRGARRRLPLRDPRPRGPALGQPQPGAEGPYVFRPLRVATTFNRSPWS